VVVRRIIIVAAPFLRFPLLFPVVVSGFRHRFLAGTNLTLITLASRSAERKGAGFRRWVTLHTELRIVELVNRIKSGTVSDVFKPAPAPTDSR
jgi:hypothetical protein